MSAAARLMCPQATARLREARSTGRTVLAAPLGLSSYARFALALTRKHSPVLMDIRGPALGKKPKLVDLVWRKNLASGISDL